MLKIKYKIDVISLLTGAVFQCTLKVLKMVYVLYKVFHLALAILAGINLFLFNLINNKDEMISRAIDTWNGIALRMHLAQDITMSLYGNFFLFYS